jgi:hypothetical protein
MKKIAFAAAVAFGLGLGAAPGSATERNPDTMSDTSSTVDSGCDAVLGSKDGQMPAHIRYCENRQ